MNWILICSTLERKEGKFTIFGELGEGNNVILREGITSARWRTFWSNHLPPNLDGLISVLLVISELGWLQAGSARFGFHDPTPAKDMAPDPVFFRFRDQTIVHFCILAQTKAQCSCWIVEDLLDLLATPEAMWPLRYAQGKQRRWIPLSSWMISSRTAGKWVPLVHLGTWMYLDVLGTCYLLLLSTTSISCHE